MKTVPRRPESLRAVRQDITATRSTPAVEAALPAIVHARARREHAPDHGAVAIV